MSRLNKFLKVFLVGVMFGLQLLTPFAVNAEEITDHQNDEDFEDYYDWDSLLEDESTFGSESVLFFDAMSEEGFPAIEGYVPEMMNASDMLPDIEESEIFLPIEPRTTPVVGSGVVQFVLEPVISTLPAGVTMEQARAAAFNARTVYHPLFATATAGATNTATSVNGRYGRDAMYLGQSGNRFRVMIAGFEGYVDRVGHRRTITVPVNGVNRTFDVTANAVFVPFNNYPNNTNNTTVRSLSHYVNRNGELFRYLTNNVTGTGGFTRFLTGPAPSWMTENTRYYSFDGVYFYRNPRNIRANGSGAVNANDPFFNYFQYLSFRSNSTITAAQIDTFIANPNNNSSWHTLNTSNSVMRGTGNDFIHAQNRYGINAILMVAKGMHESAGGTSSIARDNNNLFGQGAIDATPGQSAMWFPNPAASINNLADGWLSRGYLWHGDWRNEGPHVGNKGGGINVRYATDPYWGQKIAGWAFRLDRSRPVGQRDFNREQIAIRQNRSAVAVTNASGATLYTANPRQARFFPFLVTETSGNRLRVVTDAAIVNGVTNRTARFNRSTAVGYIQNNNVWLTGAGNPSTTPPVNEIVPPAITVAPRTTITNDRVNFRRGPGTDHELIRLLPNGANITVLGTNADGSWTYIREGNQYGWIATGFVTSPPANNITPPTITVTPRTTTTNDRVNFRRGPGTNHGLIRLLPNGTNITVLGTNADRSWTYIREGNQYGWVNTTFVATSTTIQTLPDSGLAMINARNIPLREGPGTSFSSMRALAIHTEVVILAQNTTGSWTQVSVGNQTGWVNSNRITRIAPSGQINARDIPLREGPGTGFPVIAPLGINTNIFILAETANGNWTQIRVGEEIGWVNSSRITRMFSHGHINANNIPLREGPGIQFSSVSSLIRNTSVVILAQNATGSWTQVRVGNQTGWVNSNRISPTTSGQINANNIPLREGPGVGFSSISSLARNTNVVTLAENINGNWTQVRVGDQTGWVNSNRISQR